jgi:hypothetical protein
VAPLAWLVVEGSARDDARARGSDKRVAGGDCSHRCSRRAPPKPLADNPAKRRTNHPIRSRDAQRVGDGIQRPSPFLLLPGKSDREISSSSASAPAYA